MADPFAQCCDLFGSVGSFDHRDDVAFLLNSFSIKKNDWTQLSSCSGGGRSHVAANFRLWISFDETDFS